MIWMPQREFWERLESALPPVSIDYAGWCFFHISEHDLKLFIGGIPPNRDVSGEDDQPGPVSRWYGYQEDIPVVLDFHHAHPLGDSVVIHHGTKSGAREVIRGIFKLTGSGWQESPFIGSEK